MRVVFMGTPEFAVPSLEALAQHHDVVAVVSQPDKPKGRGNKLAAPAVKEKALALGLTCLQPLRVRDKDFLDKMAELKPDVILVAAYSRLIPQSLLDLPRLGCINLHPSLLPRYRGAIPVQAAIMNGDTRTGITTFRMDAGYDTGKILLQRETDLNAKETGTQLLERLAQLGAEVLLETVQGLENGTVSEHCQEGESEYTKPLGKGDLLINWSWPATRVANFVRALAEVPAAGTLWNGQPLKIRECVVCPEAEIQAALPNLTLPEVEANIEQASPGQIVALCKGHGPVVRCGQGCVLLQSLKPAGKGWMEGWPFVVGRKIALGELMGT